MSLTYARAMPFYVTRFMGMFSSEVLLFAIPLLVYRQTQDLGAAGLVFGIEFALKRVGLVFNGGLVDRFGSKRVMMAADAARGLIALTVFSALTFGLEVPPLLLGLLGGIIGMFADLGSAALETCLGGTIPQRDMARTQSRLLLLAQFCEMVGPAAAAFVATTFSSLSMLFVFVALFHAVSVVVFSSVRLIDDRKAGAGLSPIVMVGSFVRGFKIILATPLLFLVLINTYIGNIVYGLMIAPTAGYIQEAFGMSEAALGYVRTFGAGIGIFSSLMIPALLRRFSVAAIGLFGSLAYVVTLLIMSAANGGSVFLAAMGLFYVANGCVVIFSRTERVRLIPKEHLATVMGPALFIGFLGTATAGFVMKPALALISMKQLYLCAGFIVLGTTVAVFRQIYLPHFRRAAATRVANKVPAVA